MNPIEIAKKLRPIVEQAAASLDDKTASEAPAPIPTIEERVESIESDAKIIKQILLGE